MKTLVFALFIAFCSAGCARTSGDKEWAQWGKIQIQSSTHGTFSPVYLVEVAREYLKVHQIAADDEQPILDVQVCTLERIGFVKFRQGAEHVCAVEISPYGMAVRHFDMRVAR